MAESGLTGVVLAAGVGTRLRPLTLTRPKPLLPVAGQTLLDHNLAKLAHAGAKEAIVVAAAGDRAIPRALGRERFGMPVHCVVQPEPKGTGHALSLVARFVRGTFLLNFSDNVTAWDMSKLLARHRRTGACATLALFHAADPRRHGVAEIRGDRIVRLVEKPEHPATDLASAGMFVLEPIIFEALGHLVDTGGEMHIVDAVQHLIDQGQRVSYSVLNAWRRNVNTPSDLLEANRKLLASMPAAARRKAAKGPGCRIERGAVVGAEVSMGPLCHIRRGAVVRDSILLAGVVLGEGSDVRGCILGERSRVADGVVLRGAVLGDREVALEDRSG